MISNGCSADARKFKCLFHLQHVFSLTMNERFTLDGGYVGEHRAAWLSAGVCSVAAGFLTDL